MCIRDSVWAAKDNFLLDTDGRPIFIAGVPPDYFSATGQRWGNPIYNWEYLKENNYQFWVDRIGYSSKLFDIIRIDHFRAFDTFWKIPASCPTAVEGEWIEAPGYEVIDTLKEKIPGVNLVAEDLGDLRPEVLELKDHYHLKGMKILVFSIETKGKYAYDSFRDVENMIVYTGTHDNDTLMEWYHNLTCAAKRKVRRFLTREGIRQGSVKDRLLAYTLKSKAEYAIIPMADILGQGKDCLLYTSVPKGADLLPDQEIVFTKGAVESEGMTLHLRTNGMIKEIAETEEVYFYRYDVCDGRRAYGHARANHQIRLQAEAGKQVVLEVVYEMEPSKNSAQTIIEQTKADRKQLEETAGFTSEAGKMLSKSARQFVSKRESTGGDTILAGYPFFEDWGRDTMIALPGICISTCLLYTSRCV